MLSRISVNSQGGSSISIGGWRHSKVLCNVGILINVVLIFVYSKNLSLAINIAEALGKGVSEPIGIAIVSSVVAGDRAGELVIDLLADLRIGDVIPIFHRHGREVILRLVIIKNLLFNRGDALLRGNIHSCVRTVNKSVHRS